MNLKDQISYVEHHANVEVLSISKVRARHVFEGSDGRVYLIDAVAGVHGFNSSVDAFDAVQKTPAKFAINAKQSALLASNTEKAIHARGY